MPETETKAEGTGTESGGTTTPPATTSGGISQEELNRIAAREKNEGKQAALREIAEKFGMSIEDAEQLIKAKREADTAQMSEAERKLAEADEKIRKAEERERAADERELQANVRDALRDAGVSKDVVQRAGRLLDVEVGADEAKIKDEVEALKKVMPELFKSESTEGEGQNESGETKGKGESKETKAPDTKTRGTPPPKGEGAKSGADKAKERLMSRHPHLAQNKSA